MKLRKAEGCLTVEMETATFLSAAQCGMCDSVSFFMVGMMSVILTGTRAKGKERGKGEIISFGCGYLY